MRRIPTIMASAGAAALTALVVSVAAPAIGDDGGGSADPGPGPLSACLTDHGVTGVPTDDGLKPWIRQRLDAGDATLSAALEACAPPKHAGTEAGPGDEQQLRSCLSDHGADVPSAGGADLKRWILEHKDDSTTASALKACHLVIDDHPDEGGCVKGPIGDGAGKPGASATAVSARHGKVTRRLRVIPR